jgi:hypothetical protein
VLDALQALPVGERVTTPWTSAARIAVAAIDDHGSIVFQHAVIQDAFRSTLDALVAASTSHGSP